MTLLAPRFTAYPRNPLTGRQFRLRAASARELADLLDRLRVIRSEVRLRRRLDRDADLTMLDQEVRRLEHGTVTLEQATSAYAARKDLADDTRRRARSFVTGAGASLAPLPLDHLDTARVAGWIEALRAEELRPSTVDAHWRTLRSIVRHACERRLLARVPWGSYRPIFRDKGPRLREAARTIEELAQLLVAARRLDDERALAGELAPALEAMIACAALVGLRQRELGRLRWDGIDPENRQVSFLRAKSTSRGPIKSFLLAIPELFEILARYRVRLEAAGLFEPAGPVFPGPKSTPEVVVPYASREVLARRDLRSAVIAAGLPRFASWSAQSLRDTFVTLEAAARQSDLKAVQERSRHGSIASLVRYLRSRSRAPAEPGFALASAAASPRMLSAPESTRDPQGPNGTKKQRRRRGGLPPL